MCNKGWLGVDVQADLFSWNLMVELLEKRAIETLYHFKQRNNDAGR